MKPKFKVGDYVKLKKKSFDMLNEEYFLYDKVTKVSLCGDNYVPVYCTKCNHKTRLLLGIYSCHDFGGDDTSNIVIFKCPKAELEKAKKYVERRFQQKVEEAI